MKIFLTGYMGSGKSTIGKSLANRLKVDFFDLDDEIQKKYGENIPEIFHEKGELAFRKLEAVELLQFIKNHTNDFVIALGGGTPIFFDNMKIINQTGKSIYLMGTPAYLAKRLMKEKESRPLIAHLTQEEELTDFIAKHLFERNPFYMQSQHMVKINKKSVDEISHEILSLIKKD